MKKKIIFSFSDSMHGSGCAARSIYESDKKNSSLVCLMYGRRINFKFGFLKILLYLFIQFIQRFLSIFIYRNALDKKSFNLINFNFLDFNKFKNKILNINWFNNDFISFNELIKIQEKAIITLHDLWLINTPFHHKIKYKKNILTKILDKVFFEKKKKIFLKSNFIFVVPSIWMKKKIITNNFLPKDSFKKKIYVIPNYGEEKIFFPIAQNQENQLPQNLTSFLLFYNKSFLKGVDFLLDFLNIINDNNHFGNSIIYIVGKCNHPTFYQKFQNLNFKFYDFIPRNDLVNIYNQVNYTCIFSRAESFSLVALESLFSGTPILSFKYLALNEFVKHKKNGFLINKVNKNEILKFEMWHKKINFKKNQIRNSVIKKYNSKEISKKWKSIYNTFVN